MRGAALHEALFKTKVSMAFQENNFEHFLVTKLTVTALPLSLSTDESNPK